MDSKQNIMPGEKIALFTDLHALLESTKAILKDIKTKGITKIYS